MLSLNSWTCRDTAEHLRRSPEHRVVVYRHKSGEMGVLPCANNIDDPRGRKFFREVFGPIVAILKPLNAVPYKQTARDTDRFPIATLSQSAPRKDIRRGK